MTDEQLQALILTTLKSQVIEDSATIVEKEKITAAKMDAALKSLNVDEYVTLEVIERKTIALTEEGEDNAKNGTPEFQYASAMKKGQEYDKAEIDKKVGAAVAKVGFGNAKKNKWVDLSKTDKSKVFRVADKIVDEG